MREGRPSMTAAWVAACRGLGGLLPPGEQLCDDAWGLRFGGPGAEAIALAARVTPWTTWGWFRAIRPAALSLYWVQLRTREIDDLLVDFVRRGGGQVIVLGAGYDARAVRLREELPSARFFEVDHPATQARKRRVLRDVRWSSDAPQYVAWDFERDPMSALPARLRQLGHDPAQPTFTIWEGVTMYLTERAVEDAVAAIAAWSSAAPPASSGPDSELAFEYIRRSSITSRAAIERAVANAFVLRDEPFRFGWEPAELPAWLRARGFQLAHDRSDAVVARAHLSPRHERAFRASRGGWELHLALARRHQPE